MCGPLAQRLTRHELHRHPHAALVAADVEHGHHVRMRQLGQTLRLGEQVQLTGLARRGPSQELERDEPVQLAVVGQPHRPHAPVTEFAPQREPIDVNRLRRLAEQSASQTLPSHRVAEGRDLRNGGQAHVLLGIDVERTGVVPHEGNNINRGGRLSPPGPTQLAGPCLQPVDRRVELTGIAGQLLEGPA